MNFTYFNIDNTEHVQFMYDVRTAPQVAKNLLGNPPANIEQHRSWLATQRYSRKIFLITVDVQQEVFIGYCHIYNITDTTVEVGWAFHPSYHNMGYGEEAVNQLIIQCEKLYGNRDIELFVKNDNIPAILLYVKAGFVPLKITDGIIYMKKASTKHE